MKHKPQQRVVRAWALMDDDGFMLIQFHDVIENQFYIDSRGRFSTREKLKVIPLTIHLSPLPKQKAKKKTKA
jgi:hypothetical protein